MLRIIAENPKKRNSHIEKSVRKNVHSQCIYEILSQVQCAGVGIAECVTGKEKSLPRRKRLAMTNRFVSSCHCHETLCRAGTCPRRCRNYRLRTCLFVCTVCRFADGTPSRRALRPLIVPPLIVGRVPARGMPHPQCAFVANGCANVLGTQMQELPIAHKPTTMSLRTSAHTGCGNLVQELPITYKPVCLYRLPFPRTAWSGTICEK